LNVAFVSPAPIEFTDVKADSVSCPKFTDGKILVEAIGGTPGTTTAYQYSLDGVTYQSQNIFTNLASGSYRVFVKDGQGCVKDTIVKVEQPNELIVTVLPQDSTIELGSSLKLFTNTGGYDLNAIHSYSWTPVGGLSCVDCVEPTATPYYDTEYRLDVNYLGNCIATTTVKINVNNGPDFYMPNAFSPNGNGNNDVLLLFGSGIKTVDMKIFNRWGEKVFDSNNQWTGWDGTYKGALQPPGVYTFVVVAEYLNGKKKQKNGSITLIR
jgi:gliding motility-associated-like protein